ncbi:conserved hypothetical protein [Candidatus Caldarchaeum subterraneum]|uniref:PIN domain-containing protein n=1 Tax=Caldiarchaeum subterraneum TaxID=311458 RepID=E6N6D2_CALS0|nr:conserved hypothetical protein [Candidatus Caldarchaeum subterraneum]BAJ47932.1 conserved hypothetical protein [Candidatus Caldarchaeum subterraneum]BAJ50721.1 conserved hypothetical protein [Candidatus Caldarchaeum subterraneum]
MIAIDASALACFLLKEEGWREVGEALKEGALSPDLVLKEVSNAILKRFRRGEMSKEEVDAALQALSALTGRALKVEEETKYVEEAIKVAMDRGLTVFDAVYIVFSKGKNLRLMTADDRQAKAASEEGVEVRLIQAKR